MTFAVFDPSPLTVCINCSFLHLQWKDREKVRYGKEGEREGKNSKEEEEGRP